MRRSKDELKKMRKAGRVVAEMHERIRDAVAPGVTTKELDDIGRAVIDERGARSNFRGDGGAYPGASCAPPTDTLEHGNPGAYRLREGDIISIDCGAIVQGYHGDAAFTMGVGEVSEEAVRLMAVTEASLHAGIAQMIDGQHIGDIGHAVQGVVEGAGYSVVKEYVGHAIGTQMHEKPEVPNYGRPGKGPKLRVGNVFAVEPMVNVGSDETILLDDDWTVKTADGSLAAHWEHSIAITDDGPEILTLP
jgi:methionyl aminopeptidase